MPKVRALRKFHRHAAGDVFEASDAEAQRWVTRGRVEILPDEDDEEDDGPPAPATRKAPSRKKPAGPSAKKPAAATTEKAPAKAPAKTTGKRKS
jgi:hypothetical protein